MRKTAQGMCMEPALIVPMVDPETRLAIKTVLLLIIIGFRVTQE